MLRCYQNGDLEKVKLQPEQELERNPFWENFKSPNTLVFADGEVVLGLFYPLEQYGTITVMSLIGSNCGYKSVSMVKEFKKWLKKTLQRKDINRIEITTQATFAQATQLARLLGFTYEGTIHKMFNGMDFNIWGIWK